MPHPPRTLIFGGETLTLAQWAKRTGIGAETIRSRIDHQGWTVEKALTTPPSKKFSARARPPAPAPRPCPRLKRHKGTDQAYARWRHRGKKHFRYFGQWGSREAAEAYARFAAEWASGSMPPPAKAGRSAKVFAVVEGYIGHVRGYYVKNGKPTSELGHTLAAMRVLNELYGSLPADEFKPSCLRACQQVMIERGYVRKTINAHTWRITRCFRWGVGQELVHPDTHARLKAVDYLKRGRTAAPERPKIKPVPAADLATVRAKLLADPTGRGAVVEDMIEFHLLTGMRPGELCGMRAEDIDQTGKTWLYTVPPGLNKNEHRDKPQRYWLGPKAREALGSRLADPGPNGRLWCFPPRAKDGTRRTPVSRGAYGEAVRMACDAAKVARWHPHQLRHNKATEVQRRYEDDAAAALAIGDTPAVASQVYIDPNDAARKRIAEETG